jgi:hypothetical protein
LDPIDIARQEIADAIVDAQSAQRPDDIGNLIAYEGGCDGAITKRTVVNHTQQPYR